MSHLPRGWLIVFGNSCVTTMPAVEVYSPFPVWDLPRVWSWVDDMRSRLLDDFAPQTMEAFLEWYERRMLEEQTWAVSLDGQVVGIVVARQHSPVLAETHCIFKRAAWGTPATREGLVHVFRDLFGRGIEKISSHAFKDNHTVFAMVRTLGGVKEGTLRNQTKRNGEMVDMVMFGILKADFEGSTANLEVKQHELAIGSDRGDGGQQPGRADVDDAEQSKRE